MTRPPVEMLGIYLEPTPEDSTRVGTLIRDAAVVRFLVDSTYIALGPKRPILSAAFWAPDDDQKTVVRLTNEELKVSRAHHLPPYFANLLPEGDLRALILNDQPSDAQDDFSLLDRLGTDLPGAVVARRELDVPRPTAISPPPEAAAIDMPIKFSLAGVQLKFSMLREDHKLVMPASGNGGKVIVKLEPKEWPQLCEAEYLGMRLAEAAGVQVARAQLVSADDVRGVRRALIHGRYVLAVDRFDRRGAARVHMEEFAAILGKVGDAKYSLNVETIINLIARFSADRQEAVLEAVRRVVVDVLIGNGDSHLKNWAFVYPDGRRPELSPAYDLVPTVLFIDDDQMALKLGGSHTFARVTRKKIARLAKVVGLPQALVLDEFDQLLERCLAAWPQLVRDVPLPSAYRERLQHHWRSLSITAGLSNPFRPAPPAPAVLRTESGVSVEVDDVRPARPNPTTDDRLAFTLPNRLGLRTGAPCELSVPDGDTRRLELRSVRAGHDGRARVIANVSSSAD